MVDYSRCMTEEEENDAAKQWENDRRREGLQEELRQLKEIYFALAKHDERECATYVDEMRNKAQRALDDIS